MTHVRADVPIATVEWPGAEPPVLYIHATGFHKMVWRKVAVAVGRRAVAMDLRGHGDSGKPPDGYHWSNFSLEALAVVERRGLPTPLDAVGHSCGAATLILAELERPGTFRRLVLCEPIAFPRPEGAGDNPMTETARRRRMVFPSLEDATANYLSKPPMSGWDPEVMDDYVRYGMFARPDGQWELKCPGAIEAMVYENSSSHEGWDRLHEVMSPTLIVGGDGDSMTSLIAEEQARRLPEGELAVIEGTSHFAPMEKPLEFGELIGEFFSRP